MFTQFIFSYFSGIIGSIFMDIAENFMAKYGITSGVKVEYIGRWVTSFKNCIFYHKDIGSSKSFPNEIKTGIYFHYFLAGGGISLLYPVLLLSLQINLDFNLIYHGMIFGLFTNIFPWFWLMPTFGWGFFGLKSPNKSNTLIAPTISHIAYGLGLGLSLYFFNYLKTLLL